MRYAIWPLALAVFSFAPAAVLAQTSTPAAPATEVMQKDVEKAVARALQDLKPGVNVSDHLVNLADIGKYNVAVAVVARPGGTFTGALSHDKITEIYYVLKGSGTQVTGTLVNGTRPERVSTTIGPGLSSTSPLQNPQTRKLGPGDMQIIPPGLGHVFTSIDPGGIEYLVFRVDTEHVLAMEKTN